MFIIHKIIDKKIAMCIKSRFCHTYIQNLYIVYLKFVFVKRLLVSYNINCIEYILNIIVNYEKNIFDKTSFATETNSLIKGFPCISLL